VENRLAVAVLELDVDGLLGTPADVVDSFAPLGGRQNDPTGGEFTLRQCSTGNQNAPEHAAIRAVAEARLFAA
jgi:hypothetical protein